LDFGLSRLTSLQFIQYHVAGFYKPTIPQSPPSHLQDYSTCNNARLEFSTIFVPSFDPNEWCLKNGLHSGGLNLRPLGYESSATKKVVWKNGFHLNNKFRYSFYVLKAQSKEIIYSFKNWNEFLPLWNKQLVESWLGRLRWCLTISPCKKRFLKKYIFVNNSDYCCCMLARQAKILLT
jgi:hypothetical protein